MLRGGAARARGPKPARSPRSGAGVADPEIVRDPSTGSDGGDAVLTGTGGFVPPRWCWQDVPEHPGWAADAFAASLRPLSLERSRPYHPRKFFFSLGVFGLENWFHFWLSISFDPLLICLGVGRKRLQLGEASTRQFQASGKLQTPNGRRRVGVFGGIGSVAEKPRQSDCAHSSRSHFSVSKSFCLNPL